MCIRLPHSCFVHIPRTGGLWIGRVIEQLGIKHQTLRGDIDSHFSFTQLPYNWRVLRAFSFVRNPYDWVVSRWSHAVYINAYEDHRHYGIHRQFDECVRDSLNDTLYAINKYYPGLVTRTYREMLGIGETKSISIIGATENLVEDFCSILSSLERIPIEVVKECATKVEKFNSTSDTEWSQKHRDLVDQQQIDEFMYNEQEAYQIWASALPKHLLSINPLSDVRRLNG